MNLLGKCDDCGKVGRVTPLLPVWEDDVYLCEECQRLRSYWVRPTRELLNKDGVPLFYSEPV